MYISSGDGKGERKEVLFNGSWKEVFCLVCFVIEGEADECCCCVHVCD